MEGLKPPPTLFLDFNNISESWKSWRDGFKLYLDLTMEDADESKKVKLFSYLIGESGRELLDTLARNWPPQERTVRALIEMFDEHCNPSLNETAERYRFFMRNQGAGENIDGYVTDLRVLARTCNFGDIRDSLIRDRIVCGINDSGLRERLLRERELTLENCLQICRAAEQSRENNKTILGAAVEDVHAVKRATGHNQLKDTVTCRFCGKSHEKNELKCPALALMINSVEARPNPFRDPPETPAPSCSQVKVEEDVQTDTSTSGEGSSGSVDQHYREFQKQTIKEEEDEDKDYLPADMEDILKVFPCSSCSVFYMLQIDLNKHIRSCHSGLHEDLLTQGEIEDESLLPTKCFRSDQTASGSFQTKPSNKELQRKTHQCSECGKNFSQQSSLELHQCIHTGEKPYHCPQCGKSFSRQSYLEQHQDIHTQEKKYHCSQCGKSFSQQCVLKKHQNIHTGERPYQCSQCEKSFTRQSHLKEHERIHTGEKPYHCLQCEKSFSQQSVLRKHQRLHTGERPYQCSQCGKSFTQQYHLEQHFRVHTGLKPYHCSQCGKGFSQKSYLKKHQRIHTGEKPYHCSQCGKNFTLQNRLTIHQRIHTGVRPYHCSQCGKSFTEQSNLKKHEHVHTGVKPYHCSQCGKSYTQQSSLICHQRIHTEEKPFHCSQCGRSFSNEKTLTRHKCTKV